MTGLLRAPGGGLIMGPGGGVFRVPGEAVVLPRRIEPTTVNLFNTAAPGTKIADLVFIGFSSPGPITHEREFTMEFSVEFGTTIVEEFGGYIVNLTDDAGGRVALAGSWNAGYSLVVGLTPLGGAARYTVVLSVDGIPETFIITVDIAAAVSAASVFTTRVENYDTVPSWADQEMQAGIGFKAGDVPAGQTVAARVDGVQVPCQLSNRIFWNDGSLKHCQARWLMPVIAAGQGKDVVWHRQTGSWTAQDTGLHTSTTAITSKVALEYAFTSWQGRNTAQVLTAQRGPKTFRSATMLAAANAPWIDTIMAGPVVTEWRASDMAEVGAGKDADFGCWLYVRAWGGTANNPKRIQFFFRTIYGWSTNVATDAQGIQVNIDVKVNGTTIRGNAIGTAGWGAVRSFKGGFMTSAGPTGQMDWFDVASNAWVIPPKLVHRQNIPYGITSGLVPPYDVNNPAFVLTIAPPSHGPMQRGLLRVIQDDVGDAWMIPWGTTQPHAWCIAAHARASAAQLANFEQAMRVTALGQGCMDGNGYHRTTRKVVCYLPPARNPDPAVLGASVWSGAASRPACLDATQVSLNEVISNLDAAHFPQINLWSYQNEGDQHILDQMYVEATLPGQFEANAYGFWGTMDYPSATPFGGIAAFGQVRGVGHGVRPGLAAYGMGHPADPNWKLAKAYVMHWIEMSRLQPPWSTNWRSTSGDGNNRTDGRRFQDVKLKEPGTTSAGYKPWMHYFGTAALAFGYGLTEDPDVKEQAEWWAHLPTVLAGGYHNDDSSYNLMKSDPIAAGAYFVLINNQGSGATNEDLRPWYHGFYTSFIATVTYKADNQTVVYDFSPVPAGLINVVTGIYNSNDPPSVSDMTKIPAGLTRGVPYYTVQPSGNTGKLSLSPGGPAVTFNAGGADIVGRINRRAVFGLPGHNHSAPSAYQADANAYYVQAIAALDFVQHYVLPNDARVRLARNKLLTVKDAAPGSGYDVRGKTIVPRT